VPSKIPIPQALVCNQVTPHNHTSNVGDSQDGLETGTWNDSEKRQAGTCQ